MKLLIDADACPDMQAVIACASDFNREILIVCDTAHLIEHPKAQTIIVSKGSDAVDFSLLKRVEKGDLILTQDYGLAALVLSKGAYAIHPNGWRYDANNIEELLMSRHLSKKARQAGERTKGPSKRTPEMSQKLMDTLKAYFVQLIKEDL